MSHTKRRIYLALALSGVYFLLFILFFLAASYIDSDGAVRAIGYAVDLCLSVGLSLAGYLFLCDLGLQTKKERYLLPLLPFLARLLYYLPYHTLDFTLSYDMLTEVAVPMGLLLSILEILLWYGGYLLLYLTYRRVSKEAPDGEVTPLLCCALPLALSLLSLIGGLISGLFDLASLLGGGVLLGYLLELILALLAAGASYALIHFFGKELK